MPSTKKLVRTTVQRGVVSPCPDEHTSVFAVFTRAVVRDFLGHVLMGRESQGSPSIGTALTGKGKGILTAVETVLGCFLQSAFTTISC